MLGFNGGRLGSKNLIEENGVVEPSSDPNFDDVSLLLDGTFVDRSSYASTVTSTGVVLDTSTTKFGSSSYQLSDGDQLSVPDQGQFDLGTNDFTIEGWLYRTTSNNSYRNIFGKRQGASGGVQYIYFALYFNNKYIIWISGNGSTWGIANAVDTGTVCPINTWTHFAVCREGSSIRIFNAGSLITTITTSSSISNDTTAPFQVGTDGNSNAFDGGRIEGFRVTNGVARYTASFTPPTAAFDAATFGFKASGVWTIPEVSRLRRTLVWPGDNDIVTSGLVVYVDAGKINSYPGSGTTWTDLSGNGNNGTLTNGPTFDSGNGGSIVFDGTNDFVNLGAVQINTASGTIGFWVNLDTIAGRFFGRNDNFEVRFDGSNRLVLDFGFPPVLNSIRTSWAGAWLYVVITWSQSSNSSALYVNNVLDNTGSCGTISSLTGDLHIGSSSANVSYIDGKIAVFHSYNRILTVSEIAQNFNALKGRYGL